MVSKKDIRKHVLAQRNSITKKEWDDNSQIIFKKVVSHPFFLECDVLYCYVDYNKEVQTRSIIEYAWAHNKKVAVPKIVNDEMIFFFIQSFEDLKEGFRGILEPADCEMASENSALVIMPGVAFDQQLNRIGYGRGFYDKFLEAHPDCHTIALGFEMQLVPMIPHSDFDIRPEFLITEDHIYVNKITN